MTCSTITIKARLLFTVTAMLVGGCKADNLLGYDDGGSPAQEAGAEAPVGNPPGPHDAAPLPLDAGRDGAGPTQVGPTYACGPAGAQLTCSCGLEPYFPAPIDENGQQQTFILPPDPATVIPYGTATGFDVLAVGRWKRTAGMGELICEQYGVEFTSDHQIIPLVIASDGSVQAVTALADPFTVQFGSQGQPRLSVNGGGLITSAPTFFDNGLSMYMLYAPWPANYVRVP